MSTFFVLAVYYRTDPNRACIARDRMASNLAT